MLMFYNAQATKLTFVGENMRYTVNDYGIA